MADVNAILNQRIKKSGDSSKMAAMAKQSSTGHLTSFAGVFGMAELSEKDKQSIEEILKQYAQSEENIETDLVTLLAITSEVKAIHNQAAILHGERIKKAHRLLTRYRDGAFTAWLMAAYGNRQTPYNFMQYYEFYETMPKNLRPQIEAMPRQAVYVLASRTGDVNKKQEIVQNYQGETKAEVLDTIRRTFPLHREDKRRAKLGKHVIRTLQKLQIQLETSHASELSSSQREDIQVLLKHIQKLIGQP